MGRIRKWPPASLCQLVGGREQAGQLGQYLNMMIPAGLRTVHDNCKFLDDQGGISMFRKLVIGALGAMTVLFSTTAFAQGTASDAKAMLEKTVAAIKADKAKTLDAINKGENGFLVGDLYPFCFNLSDALLVAIGNPNVKGLLGKDARTFKDPTGDVYGPRLYDAAKEGKVSEVSYMSPKAGADKTWVPKASFVTAVAGLGCGVGYYK
ncbi:cache domain-containing protein [Bradyrhizobium viridifuturi]|uniref:cache domain-containing protein n=1 Tax=Bradyrhizobium viridifuturi TaxID=1654716 RepID=UPI001FCD7002|nr:chemotaxis protein [Bradyrhizobium viridifuturi]